MGALAIAELVFTLVEKFGPKALSTFNEWKQGVGTVEPTDADWAALKKKVDEHNPDTY